MIHGMLTIDMGNNKTQYWFISESKKRTYILIAKEGKLTKDGKFKECEIIDWRKGDYIGWWICE